ncbi:ATP-dependent RNA helicase HrpA [Catenulispora yoronensis]|uniref:ATP-dependent RNA helicase HrpA n=1 Tax=Catenulispora yoronensis TaxID=450799 RepID=A0ABN2U172_9ACTN
MESQLKTASLAELTARLAELTPHDRHRLSRRIDGARRIRNPQALQAVTAEIEAEILVAAGRAAARRASVPKITYPDNLPVSARRDDIAAAIRDHQVVVIAGETGSGKTTQIPKICLELGRGVAGLIGHTQPRRLAARTVAERIAEELGQPLGETVGYKVRFTDHSSDDTLVKLMTDGILLAEIQQDRMLRRYDTIIIDEAHERSLNIDFLLGYLKSLLPRRPDLKLIITSATIDPERFARHFADRDGEPAPIVEVSGRTYPVEVRYRPLLLDDPELDGDAADRDQVQAISDAVDELGREGQGDILVFLSGEREIRDTADALKKRNLRHTEIVPLFARLSSAEQHKVFEPHTGRRIVLATNVAETSLTVPGIRYVIDPGSARISRYSNRTKVQRLPIEPVSQASANQRKGRCGRLSDGICIRLYSEDDFLSRPEFTEPEILRTSLASVILQMSALGLGDVAAFPFLDPPDARNIRDGVNLLHELGALDPEEQDLRKRLTPVGRKLAQLPVDPKLGRMVLEADRNGALKEIMIIAAALSIQDPRERPADKQQAAAEKHARFKEQGSDFLAWLKLWDYIKEKQKELSSNQFRKLCKAEFLHYLRIREWQDVHSQLKQIAKQLELTPNTVEASPDQIHISLLSGLLSHIGLKDTESFEYIGARNAKFAISPGSVLFKKSPQWVMAAELVETSRLWGRVVAIIKPEWAEPLAQHLVKRTYSEPHWEKSAGAVMAFEKVTLYGIPLVASRKVNYGSIDAEVSRELFIRHALVEGDWQTHHKFFSENRKLLAEVEELENRARRRDILVDDETLFDFYDDRVPADVVSARHFDSWWKKTQRDQPDLLSFEKSMLINDGAGAVVEQDYPDSWRQGRMKFKLTYQFEPGADADGVTVHIPLTVLNQVTGDGFDWLIPGLREDLLTALIKAMPKTLRVNFVPAPNFAKALRRSLVPNDGPLLEAMARELRAVSGHRVEPTDFDLERVPEHLKMTFRIIDDKGHRLAEGKDLEALKTKLKVKTRDVINNAADGLAQEGLKTWTVGTLAKTFEQKRSGLTMKAYPALADAGDSVAVRLYDTAEDQRRAMAAGTRRMLLLNVNSPIKYINGRLSNPAKLALSHNPYGNALALLQDCVACAADHLIAKNGGPAWDEASYQKLFDAVRADLADTSMQVVQQVERILAVWQEVERRMKATTSRSLLAALADVRAQLTGLVHKGFVSATGFDQLPQLVRYLRAVERRLDKLPDNPNQDQLLMYQVHDVQDEYQLLLDRLPPGRRGDADVRRIRWMLEELRVSLFAQQLGTPETVSAKRIYRAIDAISG